MPPLPPRNAWRVRRRVRAPAQSRFRAEEGTEAFAVRVVVEQEGFVTGWDEGAMGFELDAVWFSGECTSFRVCAADLRTNFRLPINPHRLPNGFPLRHPSRDVWVRVVPLSGSLADVDRLTSAFMWLRQRPEGKGESQYPPLVPRPGALVWRPKTGLVRPPGSVEPLASLLERTGLLALLATDLNLVSEWRQRSRLLREIAREEEAPSLSPPGERDRSGGLGR